MMVDFSAIEKWGSVVDVLSEKDEEGGYISGGWKSEGGRLSCGFSSLRGKRATMEDLFDIKTFKIDGQTVSLVGIFYGESYQQTDAAFLDSKRDTYCDDGNHLYVAKVGDSWTTISKMLGFFQHRKLVLHFQSLHFWMALMRDLMSKPKAAAHLSGDGSDQADNHKQKILSFMNIAYVAHFRMYLSNACSREKRFSMEHHFIRVKVSPVKLRSGQSRPNKKWVWSKSGPVKIGLGQSQANQN